MSETLLADPHRIRGDQRLIERAVRKGWIIPDDVMEAVPEAMAKMVTDSSADERVRINAARVLVAMHGQNQKGNEAPKQGPTINVGVQVDARTVDDRAARIREIAERVRTQRVLVDGRSE